MFRTAAVGVLLGGASAAVAAADLPSGILRQLPRGYSVLTSTTSTVGARQFQFVSSRSEKELSARGYLTSADEAPDRPLLIFELGPNGRYVPVGRNDKVIATADGAEFTGTVAIHLKTITSLSKPHTSQSKTKSPVALTGRTTLRSDLSLGSANTCSTMSVSNRGN